MDVLIDKIYPTIGRDLPDRRYLTERVILAIANKDV